MKKYLIILLLFLAYSCQNGEKKIASKVVINGDSIEIEKVNVTIKSLQGVWAEKKNDNAIFFIKDDSLYYLEDQNHPVPIFINEDTLIIKGDVPARCKILKLTKDSLWYKDEFNQNITKLYRR